MFRFLGHGSDQAMSGQTPAQLNRGAFSAEPKYEGSTSLDPGASFRTARPRNASRRRPFSLPMPETRNCGSSPDAQSLVVSRQLGSRSGQPLSDAAGNGLDVLVLAIDGC